MKTPSFPTRLLRCTFYFYKVSVLGLLKCTDGSVLAFLKVHRRFRIGPPKIRRMFHIGPPQVTLNVLPPEFQIWWLLCKKRKTSSYLK